MVSVPSTEQIEKLNQEKIADGGRDLRGDMFEGDRTGNDDQARAADGRTLGDGAETDAVAGNPTNSSDHTLHPGDGTVPDEKQVSDANDYGASQKPQEEFINARPRGSVGDLDEAPGAATNSSESKPEGDLDRTPEGP